MGVRSLFILAGIMTFLLPAAALAQAPGPPGEVVNQGRRAAVITPTDNAPLALGPTRWLYVGTTTACTIAVILADDTAAVTFTNVSSTSTWMPLRAKVVMATNTTCTGIVGVW